MHVDRTTRSYAGSFCTVALVLCTANLLAAQESPFDKGFVEGDGGRVFFETEGSGFPTVLIHGGMVDRTMWNAQMEPLRKQLMVIRFDMRGAGESPISEAYFPAEDVTALLDHLGIDRANIVGLSNGGAIAIDYTLAHPDRVASLVLAEPGVTGFQFNPQIQQTMMRAASQMSDRDFPAATQTLLATPAFTYSRDHKPESFEHIQRMVSSNLQSFAMFPRYRWHEPDAMSRLGEVTVPTLVLVSEHAGPDALKIAGEIVRQMPDVERAVVSDAGHMMNIDNPNGFNREVLRFLTGR